MAHLKKLSLGSGGNLESISGKKPQHSGFLLKKKTRQVRPTSNFSFSWWCWPFFNLAPYNFICEKIFTQYSFFVFKFVDFSSLCFMKCIIFLYINTNKKFVLLYLKQLQLQLRKGPVEKSSSLKISLQF